METMLKRGNNYNTTIEEDMKAVPIPSLTKARIQHVKSTILPHLSDDERELWLSKMASEDADEVQQNGKNHIYNFIDSSD